MPMKKNNDTPTWAEEPYSVQNIPPFSTVYDTDGKRTTPYDPDQPVDTKLFDITCVVGSVYSGGDEDPYLVAFRMIAQHSQGSGYGEYSFPNLDGDLIHVNIEKEEKKQSN